MHLSEGPAGYKRKKKMGGGGLSKKSRVVKKKTLTGKHRKQEVGLGTRFGLLGGRAEVKGRLITLTDGKGKGGIQAK